MILSLYRGVTTLCGPLISHYLKKRLARGKEHPTRFPERLGNASITRPDGKLVWLHGASVGEAISLLPIMEEIQERFPDHSILMTTGTVTSAKLMESRLPKGIIHQFIPVDRLPYVRKFLDHWKPDLAIWLESELWPNLVTETHNRGTNMVLLNGRMSKDSYEKWHRFSGLAKDLLGCFDLCLAQAEKDRTRYDSLGADPALCLGNIKYGAPDLPADICELKDLEYAIGDRRLWLAASTHPGEEPLIGRVHKELRTHFPKILTIIAPRHPERGDSICQELKDMGLNVCQRSKEDFPGSATDIYIADTLGEMGLLYRLAPLVFMGKSMTPLGGQNPIEPARLDCALLCGPYMTNFPEVMANFEAEDAISIVRDEAEMAQTITDLLMDEEKLTIQAGKAKAVAYQQAAVMDRTMDALTPFFTDDPS